MVCRYKKPARFIHQAHRPVLWMAALIWLLFCSTASAGPVLTINADDQFNFAEHLFASGEFFRAIGEYQRFIYFFPQDPRAAPALYKIGMSYHNSERFREAITSFKNVIEKYRHSDLTIQAHLMISESHFRRNEIGPAIINLNNLIALTDDENIRDEAYYRIGWIYLETASWEKARTAFNKISAANHDKYRLKQLAAELEKEKSIGRKSPGLAGALSIIPGAGFLYCERYQDALIAFLLNGGLILAAYEAFEAGNEALGGVITFVEAGFYAGNIYGATSSAHKHNRTLTTHFIENLRQNTKIGLSSGLDRKSVAFFLKYSF